MMIEHDLRARRYRVLEASVVCLVYFTLSAGWLFLSRRLSPVS